MLEALDIEPGSEQWLPFAQKVLLRLKVALNGMGLNFGRRTYKTPEGGDIIVRTRRGRPRTGEEVAFSQDAHPDSWYDYIKISGSVGGFVVQPQITAPGLDLEARYALITYNNGNFSMFPYTDMSRYPQNRSRVVTSGATPTFAAGAFQGAKFTAFEYPTFNQFEIVGAFLHTYTPVGATEMSMRLLAVHRYGAIYDTVTGDALTVGGDAIAGDLTIPLGPVDNVHFVSDKRGQNLVMEFYDPVNRYAVTVDFAAEVQVVAERIVDDTPYGSRITATSHTEGPIASHIEYTWDMQPYTVLDVTIVPFSNLTQVTAAATYPITYGVNGAGDQVVNYVDITESESTASSGMASADGFFEPLGELVIGNGATNRANTATIRLPNGNSKVFDISRIDSSSASSVNPRPAAIGGASAAGSAVSGTLSILYSDPAVPVVVYQYAHTDLSYSDSASGAVEALEGSSYAILGTRTSTTTTSLEVGVLVGAAQRVLFTDSVATQGTVPAYVGATLTVGAVGGGGTTPITTNPYRKQLRNVTLVDPADVISNRYSVSIRSPSDWLVSVSKLRDISSNPVKEFAIYAGRINETNLRQAFLDYLAAHASDPATAAAIAAGNLSSYNIRLHLDGDLHTVASYV